MRLLQERRSWAFSQAENFEGNSLPVIKIEHVERENTPPALLGDGVLKQRRHSSLVPLGLKSPDSYPCAFSSPDFRLSNHQSGRKTRSEWCNWRTRVLGA